MKKKYQDLQFSENEFYHAYSLALKAAGSHTGTIARVENTHQSYLKELELYTELQRGIKVVETSISTCSTR